MTAPAAALVEELRPHVADERVLQAIAEVPRDAFVPQRARGRAWANEALPIGAGQTISQPLVVARMCELLRLCGSEQVLDVGTGSGYHAAVLARLARWVHTIEVRESLSRRAGRALEAAGVANLTLHVGDGSLGLPGEAPFDAINVAAAGAGDRLAPLVSQLGAGGRLVAPVVLPDGDQALVVLARDEAGELSTRVHERVRFVPLVGF
jgi:protein-L-isoaspartate(D-aspartate) O-methyltransferase